MGLHISVASKIELIPDALEDFDDGFRVGPNIECFVDRADGVQPGIYRVLGEEFGFAAGSYGGYNEWREQLAELAGYPPLPYKSDWESKARSRHAAGAWAAKEGPFWELIHFADNEGCIGPKTSAKLAKDFADFQAKADEHASKWFRGRYAEWRRAFELASDNGAVSFH